MPAPFPVLILGGTREAMALAERLAGRDDYAPLMSFAGRTTELQPPPIAHRVGGFGGVENLAAFLRDGGYAAVVDATHPFSARMSDNAALACGRAHIPLMVYTRPAWTPTTGDDWTEVDSYADAAAALGDEDRVVFLALGRQRLAAFRDIPQRCVVRTIEAVDAALLPRRARLIRAHGPFDADSEASLMRDNDIGVVVSKNAGGGGAYGKIVAARQLKLPVIMIRRPRAAAEGELHDADAVMSWLEALRLTHGTAS